MPCKCCQSGTVFQTSIEIAPTLSKPENMTEEAFASAKNQALAMAHSGLGLVYVRRGSMQKRFPSSSKP